MNESVATAYPLSWPAGWPRTRTPSSSRFDRRGLTTYKAMRMLLAELRLLGARRVVVSTNVELKRDGTPYSNRRPPSDSGVAVYFVRNGQEQCIPCDRWQRVEENLWAIVKSVEAIRGLERWGAKNFIDAAFRGFKALPETTEGSGWWREVLGFHSGAQVAADEIRSAYRRKALELHPDNPTTGNQESFLRLQKALQAGLEATNG